MNWIVVSDAEEIAARAVEKIQLCAQQAIRSKGMFSLVLAGGSTPQKAYQQLAMQNTDWAGWQFYFGDERCLPIDDEQRNSVMADTTLFQHIPVSRKQVHVIAAEKGSRLAADLYSREISLAMPFDLVLLGLGEDGHTASLFPGKSYPQQHAVVAVHDAPKPPSERVSLNYPSITSAHDILFMVSGKGKADAVKKWRNGDCIPAACFTKADVLVDEAAWYE